MRWRLVLAGAMGYLIGSISFARIIGRFVAPGANLNEYAVDLPGSDGKYVQYGVNATSISMRNPMLGGVTSLLDIAKVLVPALALKRRFPNEPFHVVFSALAVVGHDFPIYYRFQGGRGLSPMVGGMLVIDWVGLLATNASPIVLVPLAARSRPYLAFLAGVPLLLPWFLITRRDRWHVGYAVVVNLAYWLAHIPELREFRTLSAEDKERYYAEVMRSMQMGRSTLSLWRKLGLAPRDDAA